VFRAVLGASMRSTIVELEELAELLLMINSKEINLNRWRRAQAKLKASQVEVDPLIDE
jgi:hypothetical protein